MMYYRVLMGRRGKKRLQRTQKISLALLINGMVTVISAWCRKFHFGTLVTRYIFFRIDQKLQHTLLLKVCLIPACVTRCQCVQLLLIHLTLFSLASIPIKLSSSEVMNCGIIPDSETTRLMHSALLVLFSCMT